MTLREQARAIDRKGVRWDRSRSLTNRRHCADILAGGRRVASGLRPGPRGVGVLAVGDLGPGTMKDPLGSRHGQLLGASPAMTDPNFLRPVVAIANHDEDGALGIVLNRPSDTEVVEAVPELEDVFDSDEVVFVGGPVQPASIVVLAEFDDPAEAAYLVVDAIGLVSDRTGLDRLEIATARRRVYAGYTGWGPGQLEAELEREDWIVEPAQPQDVFDDDPLDLWTRVLERKGGQFRLLARMPIDPSVN